MPKQYPIGTGVRGHVYRVASYEPYPWVFEVDYVRPDGKRDTSIDSYDYGSLATQAEALDAACTFVAQYADEHDYTDPALIAEFIDTY